MGIQNMMEMTQGVGAKMVDPGVFWLKTNTPSKDIMIALL